jgi:hypothetical protein
MTADERAKVWKLQVKRQELISQIRRSVHTRGVPSDIKKRIDRIDRDLAALSVAQP